MRWLITALCVSLLMSGGLCVAQEAEKPATPYYREGSIKGNQIDSLESNRG